MKVLVTLGVLQTLALLVLIFRSHGAEPQSHSAGPSFIPSASATVVAPCDEACVRRILREELAQHIARLQPSAPAPIAPARDEAKDRVRLAAVAQQFENYKSAGAITQQQMFLLQAEIAQLDPASRDQAMRSLARAINRDEIKLRE